MKVKICYDLKKLLIIVDDDLFPAIIGESFFTFNFSWLNLTIFEQEYDYFLR